MDFAAKTITLRETWASPDIVAQIDGRASVLTEQGLTDGIKHFNMLPNGEQEYIRFWTTVEAADEWISFVTTYGPHSATVIEL